MKTLKSTFKHLSVDKIESSPEITQWLSQFNDNQKPIAKIMLSKLTFISRDEFTRWLRKIISKLPEENAIAFYSVRKLNNTGNTYWDSRGNVISRPGHSQGSEDLVYSIISNIVRSSKNKYLDHPSIIELKGLKVRNYVLIDDSIGSGERVSEFINAMLSHPTFLSWWSLGLVRITLISFARTMGSEARIINAIRGSDHGCRKFRKSEKIEFISKFVYHEKWLESRWGKNYSDVLSLCYNHKKIPKWARLGYGEVLSNIVFYHSVPNNTPGIFWFSDKKWQGLMPERAIPNWLLDLLDNDVHNGKENSSPLSPEIVKLLDLIKCGVRDKSSISMRLNVDYSYVNDLIQYAEKLGLLTAETRLSKVGLNTLINAKLEYEQKKSEWDFSLYIPTSWCVD